MKNRRKRTDMQELARKWEAGTISDEERDCFEKWYASFNDEEVRITGSKYESREQMRRALLNQVHTAIAKDHLQETQTVASFAWTRVAAAVIAVLLLGGGGYLFLSKKSAVRDVVSRNDIAPGGNKAVLTLADGEKIILGDAADGKLAEQAGLTITKSEDGLLVYEEDHASLPSEDARTAYNKIETPRGGQYQVELPDGSLVWLNAASSLRYPARFADTERVVELTGEAYFEVASDPARPFRVSAGGQHVEVLGTRFNVNTYQEEEAVKTTLLEGSVIVRTVSQSPNQKQEIHLKPGEQSLLQGSMLSKRQVDAEAAVDWKNGLFIFNNEPLAHILRKISRWYDVDIVYRDAQAGKEVFWGSVSRFSKVSEVLAMLEETGNVHFNIKEKTIEVKTKGSKK